MTAVPPLGDADPATRILVAGYGAMTGGIIPHLTGLTATHVTIASRHLKEAPLPGTVLIRPDGIARARPDVVIGCFADDESSRTFWQHPQTRAAVRAHRSTCIELSTISPAWAESWHARITEAGGLPVECPVTGSRPGAQAGELTAFVHHPGPLDPAGLRVLDAFTARRFAFFHPGNPARFKVIFNAWGAALLHCAGVFARQLPEHLAEDYATAADAITSVGWMATLAASKLDRIERSDYSDADFAVQHMLKDLELARDLLGDLPLITTTAAAYTAAMDLHGPWADFTAVADRTGEAS
ncbi:NAD(P)-binding domain-containing protein [Streptomyces erythrochromogenes]|uniref:NAD(P)-binding domain-containing protein n=1 Tax=Streptomyces erythrochromogenes TaxID=285574 RepID=UPI003865262C|nr:NAD(P)-binding domain-containing protein [Streptomyces erythrochromogenes]WSR88292.1 NAD(P)-binding domain-containing protein [Streptomyces erythrochromogenes]